MQIFAGWIILSIATSGQACTPGAAKWIRRGDYESPQRPARLVALVPPI
jgi:hypothetical protein